MTGTRATAMMTAPASATMILVSFCKKKHKDDRDNEQSTGSAGRIKVMSRRVHGRWWIWAATGRK